MPEKNFWRVQAIFGEERRAKSGCQGRQVRNFQGNGKANAQLCEKRRRGAIIPQGKLH